MLVEGATVELLFALNLVTLLMQIQCTEKEKKSLRVVICFKFSNFAYANTVSSKCATTDDSCYLL